MTLQSVPVIHISIHAPRMGSDMQKIIIITRRPKFQSTLPAWGATSFFSPYSPQAKFQSTLPAWGATAQDLKVTLPIVYFNPRSPHGERHAGWETKIIFKNFNPRSPHGERLSRTAPHKHKTYFNPRSPHGERLTLILTVSLRVLFQSTLPAWGATVQSKHTAMTA